MREGSSKSKEIVGSDMIFLANIKPKMFPGYVKFKYQNLSDQINYISHLNLS